MLLYQFPYSDFGCDELNVHISSNFNKPLLSLALLMQGFNPFVNAIDIQVSGKVVN